MNKAQNRGRTFAEERRKKSNQSAREIDIEEEKEEIISVSLLEMLTKEEFH